MSAADILLSAVPLIAALIGISTLINKGYKEDDKWDKPDKLIVDKTKADPVKPQNPSEKSSCEKASPA